MTPAIASEPYKLEPAPLSTSADSNCVTSTTLGETPVVGSVRTLLSRSPSRMIKRRFEAEPTQTRTFERGVGVNGCEVRRPLEYDEE